MTKPPHPVLTPDALARIYAHAAREYPKECCGIVFGPKRPSPAGDGAGAVADEISDEVADDVRPCENIQDALHAEDPAPHPRDARTAYNLGPADIFALSKSLRGERPAKIVYHSHVDVGAYFSDTDQAAAVFGDEPAYPVEYVVVDAQRDGAAGCAQFAWDDEVGRYVEVRRYPR